MSQNNIKTLLEAAADNFPAKYVLSYPLNHTESCHKTTYGELRALAIYNSKLLRAMDWFQERYIVLLHFESHLDNIIWLWSTIYAGCIPAMSTPFVNSPEHCLKHLAHLKTLLDDPICLTRSNLRHQFPSQDVLRLQSVEDLKTSQPIPMAVNGGGRCFNAQHKDTALLMLTSGSTGNSKAVNITHKQVLASVKGKAAFLPLDEHLTFLNWVGLDHVGSLIEIHLHAMFVGAEQIHVQAPDMISNPLLFLEMIARHRVGRTFAPNFFLANLLRSATSHPPDSSLDLSCLRYIVSGGEANVVETCDAVSRLLCRYQAPRNVIVPGFGMTETCAGCIYSLNCPEYDLQNGKEFASLGNCVEGIEMRISSVLEAGSLARADEPGNLEVKGPIVFNRYFNNDNATAEAFTPDGWFKTGDLAILDSEEKLYLTGRSKELISINGIKYLPHELESAIEDARIDSVKPSYTVCFSHRPAGAQTEGIWVVYLPEYEANDIETRVKVMRALTTTVLLQTGARPQILPLDSTLLQKTTLGKLSRTKIRIALEKGEYRLFEDFNERVLKEYNSMMRTSPANDAERLLLELFKEVIDDSDDIFGVETPIFDWGITSIELIRYKQSIQRSFSLQKEIPMIVMMTNTTVRSLAGALANIGRTTEYNPVVKLQAQGEKSPLWLVHPGVGEILVFLGLTRYIIDRPVYALRARGFNPGEIYFRNISEAVSIYHAAIKQEQPHGPYALAGYSYGAMLAFEIAKVLEHNGDEVRFLGSFNLPPHIKFRMQQLDWTECLLHLAYFLGLISEQYSQDVSPQLHTAPRDEAIAHISSAASSARMEELSLTPETLSNWADLAFALQSMARDYDPSGLIEHIDVFYCEPLAIVAANKGQWLAQHLNSWNEFTRTKANFHEVGGSHYTMLAPEHINSFQKKLRKVLASRNL